ncbi:hypothetical protein GCM10017691_25020 [Pseudonocardia petroleophila]|uniref:Uncharacterized protein n=1 Tax=Pseudonocardia petroleophila TaxID=37331 RepID=A0A7G7MFK4_9PSEU|nr:hypothetical protein [Pseudonocardia petroleophila]QNG51565.1 hypothetical protein H6H00_26205 [Pseudonocardia petroleophila]
MTPDQGLRYELAGVIGGADALAALAAVLGAAAVPLDAAGLALLPVTPELSARATPAALCGLGSASLPGGAPLDAQRRESLLTGPESGFGVLTPGLAVLVEAASVRGPLVYVEADYLGRDGRQTAAVWRAGALVAGPLLLGSREEFVSATAPVSVALRALGVVATGRRDEFVVAGLGRHRRTVDWLRSDGPPGD